MIKVENIDVWGFEHAIRGMRAKGYRIANGKYETFVSNKSKSINLGTYATEQEAQNAVYQYRVKRFIESVSGLEADIATGRVYQERYVVYPTGNIYNLRGKKMVGAVDRNGYIHGLINGKNMQYHRVVAETFIENPQNKPFVNHKDGNKQNNAAKNLEWVTASENIKHAYTNGLEKIAYGESHHAHKLTEEIVRYIRRVYKKRHPQYGAVALAKKFGIDRTTVFDVVLQKTWKEVQM